MCVQCKKNHPVFKCYDFILPVEEYGQNNLVVTAFVGGPANGGLSVT